MKCQRSNVTCQMRNAKCEMCAFQAGIQLDPGFQVPEKNKIKNPLKILINRIFKRFVRRDWDSNPGYTFGVHTLSRRAPSTTRTPLQVSAKRCTGASAKQLLMTAYTEFRVAKLGILLTLQIVISPRSEV